MTKRQPDQTPKTDDQGEEQGSSAMSKEQKEGKDQTGRHIAEELQSHTDEGERVKRVDNASK